LLFFFSIWNVFNKRTPNEIDWEEYSGDLYSEESFPRILVLGLEFEF
jgi:hypothetical protein